MISRRSKRINFASHAEEESVSKKGRLVDIEVEVENVSAFEIISSISMHETDLKYQKRQDSYSWDAFQSCILKDPDQVTDVLFLQALAIPIPLIPLEVISTMMKMNRKIVSIESAKLITTMTWIPIDYARHILRLEQDHAREMTDERGNKAKVWLKVFESLKDKCALPPRLQVTEVIIRWLHDDPCVWDSVLSSCCWYQDNFPYLTQLLEMTSVEMDGPFPESIQRKICEISIIRIVSFWEDRAAENALRKLCSIHQLQTEFVMSTLAKSRLLKISFQRSMFHTSKYIMLVCPYSVLGFDPSSSLERYCRSPLLTDILEQNHGEKTIEVMKCYIELYIYLTLELEYSDQWADRARVDNCYLYACGGLYDDYDHYQGNREIRGPSFILHDEYEDYSEDLHRGIINYLMDCDRSAFKDHRTDQTLDLRIQWHLMALFSFAVKSKMWTLIEWAIYEYPIVLIAKKHGVHAACKHRTLLHMLCSSRNTPSTLIQTIIEQGIKYGIERGGLITENYDGDTPIEIIGRKKGPQILKLFNFLMDHSPQRLILQSDFTDRYLFHSICRGGQPSVARKFLKMFPNVLSITDDFGRLPIHVIFLSDSATNPPIFRLLLKEGLKQGIGKDQGGMAGLLVKDNRGLTPLDYLVKKEPNPTNSSVKVLFSGIVPDVPLIALLVAQNSLYVPIPEQAKSIRSWVYYRIFLQRNLYHVIQSYPMSIRTPGPDGRLPIHVAIHNNLGNFGGESSVWNYIDRSSILDRSKSHAAEAYKSIRNQTSCLSCIDPITGLYPFLMIASKQFFKNCIGYDESVSVHALSEIYTMLTLDPSPVVLQKFK